MTLLRTVAYATPLLAATFLVTAQDPAPDEPLRHARVSVDGARVRNLADDKGIVVAELEQGALVAVYAEHEAGWLLIEIPGGYAVWVFGRYLTTTDVDGVLEVTSNAVNIRPQPSSEVTNFPLPQRLHAGDRVRLIEQAEEGKPLSASWVRVWSPPGVRAWLRASATETLSAGESGAVLWAAALRAGNTAAPVVPKPTAKAAPAKAAVGGTELEAARSLLEIEQAREDPDFGGVRAAYAAVLAAGPSETVAIEARADLDRVTALEEAAGLRAELELERERRAGAAQLERERVDAAARAKDPLGGVFLSRGAILRRVGSDGVPRYVLRFGKNTVSEVVCASGRYDLELFAGYEIGVQGKTLGSAQPRGVPVIEVSRIEVIARR